MTAVGSYYAAPGYRVAAYQAPVYAAPSYRAAAYAAPGSTDLPAETTHEGTPTMGYTDSASNDAFSRLASDVARVCHDFWHSSGSTDAAAVEVVREVRAELDHVDVDTLVAAGVIDPDTAASYRAVQAADEAAVTSAAVTSHAEGIAEGSIASWYGDNDEAAEYEEWVDEELERVVTAESADADAAVAVACAAAAQAQREAHAAGDTGAVAVIVVEDVESACDEDGGF